MTPAQRHAGEDHTVLRAREQLYAQARARNPARWSGAPRNWTRPGTVWLNPAKPERQGVTENRLITRTTFLTNNGIGFVVGAVTGIVGYRLFSCSPKMSCFVIGDIQGHLDPLPKLLTAAGADPVLTVSGSRATWSTAGRAMPTRCASCAAWAIVRWRCWATTTSTCSRSPAARFRAGGTTRCPTCSMRRIGTS